MNENLIGSNIRHLEFRLWSIEIFLVTTPNYNLVAKVKYVTKGGRIDGMGVTQWARTLVQCKEGLNASLLIRPIFKRLGLSRHK